MRRQLYGLVMWPTRLVLALNEPFALGDMPLGHRQMPQEHGPVHTSDQHKDPQSRWRKSPRCKNRRKPFGRRRRVPHTRTLCAVSPQMGSVGIYSLVIAGVELGVERPRFMRAGPESGASGIRGKIRRARGHEPGRLSIERARATKVPRRSKLISQILGSCAARRRS
jgi:hypothetical protein